MNNAQAYLRNLDVFASIEHDKGQKHSNNVWPDSTVRLDVYVLIVRVEHIQWPANNKRVRLSFNRDLSQYHLH